MAAAIAMVLAPLAAPAGAAETVSLSASSQVMTFGQRVTLSGQIAGDPACAADRPVELEWRAADSAAWAVVGTTTSATDGTFAFENGQGYTGRFKAQLEATSSCGAASSAGVAVRVRAFVDTALLAGSLVAGSCVDIQIEVSPSKPGDTVKLQRRSASGWATVQSLTLDALSSAQASPCFGWDDIGLIRMRVRWPQQDTLNMAGTGITLAFRIEETPWMQAIDDAIGGRSVSVDVEGAGRTLFEHAQAAPRTPASNEKLLLSMALLDTFGPGHRIPTFAAAADVAGGVVRGNLWILGRGDPEIGRGRMGALAARLADAGISAVRGRVMGATTYFRHDWWARGWKPRVTRQYVALPSALTFEGNIANGREIRDPEVRAAASLTSQLERRGIRVKGRPGSGVPPAGASPIAGIRSRPLSRLLARMDRPSDNFYAEVLGKALGAARSGPPGTIAKGASAIEAFTDSYGTSFALYDGSGLSYDDRVSAEGILSLLGSASRAPWGPVLRRALPSGGEGTLEHRLRDVRVRAKTGTLDGISALSGWIWLEREGRWARFSILSAGMSKDTAVAIEDRIVHVLANRATIV